MYTIKRISLLLIFLSASILFAQTTKLFWAEQMTGKIQSIKIDGTGLYELANGLDQPYGLAIDTESSPNKIYYGARNESKIYRANLDGSNPEEVITDITGITDIELDLVHRKIYWARNTYNDDAVQRADMDGLNLNIEDMFASTSVGYDFLGVGLDVAHSKVYWVQRYNGCSDKIACINFDKTEATYVVTYPDNSLIGPFDIDVYGDKIYWTDCGVGQDIIYKANLDGSAIDTVVKEADCQYFVIDPVSEKLYFSEDSYMESINLDGTDRDTIASGTGGFIMGIDISHNAPSDISNIDPILESFELHQNFPNPFNPSTTIRYTVRAQNLVPQQVNLSIFNTIGQKVATVVNKKQSAGNYKVEWNASGLSSGVYLYRLQAGDHVQTKKMIFMK